MGQPTKRILPWTSTMRCANAAILATRSRSGWQQRRISMVLGHHQAVRSTSGATSVSMSPWISLAATWWGEGWHRVNPHYWPSSSARPLEKQKIKAGQLTIHADRGSSMRSKPVAFLLADLGVTKTHSRPNLSDDNRYSKSSSRQKNRMGFGAWKPRFAAARAS